MKTVLIKLEIKDLQVFMHKIVQWSYELSEGTLLYYLIRDQGMFDYKDQTIHTGHNSCVCKVWTNQHQLGNNECVLATMY